MNQEDEITIRQYLLGQLAEQERRQFEERLMTDNELFNQVMTAEEELAEEYADGSLASGERKQVERIFLSTPEGREQLNFNIALNKYISEESTQKNAPQPLPAIAPAPRRITFADIFRHQMPLVAMALAAMMMLAALSAWFVIRSSRLESQLDQLRADQSETQRQIDALKKDRDNAVQESDRLQKDNQARQDENQALQEERARLAEQLASRVQPGSDTETGIVESEILLPGDPRGSGDIDVIQATPGTKTVRLKLKVPGIDYRSFRAEIARDDGYSTSAPRGALKSNRIGSDTQITIMLPAKSLPPGDYRLKLTPIAANTDEQIEAHHYRFRIAPK